jgi:hypothetical protein
MPADPPRDPPRAAVEIVWGVQGQNSAALEQRDMKRAETLGQLLLLD